MKNTTMARNIRLLRQSTDMKNYQFAKAIGVTPQTVSNWCVGKYRPEPEKVSEIAEAFGVMESEIYTDIDAPWKHEIENPQKGDSLKLTTFSQTEILHMFNHGELPLYVPIWVAAICANDSQEDIRSCVHKSIDRIAHRMKGTKVEIETAAIKPYFRRHQVCQEKTYLEEELINA